MELQQNNCKINDNFIHTAQHFIRNWCHIVIGMAEQKLEMEIFTWFEFDVVGDFGCSNVQLDGVMSLDDWVWVTDGTSIVCYQEWNVFSTQLSFLDFAQLVLQL